MPASAPTTRLLSVIRAEFDEMPDMHLTREQFRRLWTLSVDECDELLDKLLRSGFLVRGRQDRFRRHE